MLEISADSRQFRNRDCKNKASKDVEEAVNGRRYVRACFAVQAKQEELANGTRK